LRPKLQINLDVSYQLIKETTDQVVIFFDNAGVYAVGEAKVLKGKVLKTAGWERSDLVLSTKILWGGNDQNDKG
jgi:aryl-alcohol dehydrogenase-like predicted oxidoreductase